MPLADFLLIAVLVLALALLVRLAREYAARLVDFFDLAFGLK